MRRDLKAFLQYQVFLNYPFDAAFNSLADAMSFGVVAGGLLPVTALDLTSPDRPRLEMLMDAIQHCHYSAHDLSRSSGAGAKNLARMNMPIEMGMALFHALVSQRNDHRCIFFVATAHDYKSFASDLAGLDPKCHENDESRLLADMYEWLRGVVPREVFNPQPTVDVVSKYKDFRKRLKTIKGTAGNGKPSYEERREVMFQVCAECDWWDWRETRAGREQFPSVPLHLVATPR